MPSSLRFLQSISEADIAAFTDDPTNRREMRSIISVKRALFVRGYLRENQVDGNWNQQAINAFRKFKAEN